MAQIQKIVDTSSRVVYKFVGNSTESRVIKIDTGLLRGAMNANNMFSANAGDDRKPQYRLSLKNIKYDVGSGIVELSSDGDANANTIMYLSGQNSMGFDEGGAPVSLDCGSFANSTGNIWLSYSGSSANSYTVIADFRKNPSDFSQGALEDPMAFNAGNRAF